MPIAVGGDGDDPAPLPAGREFAELDAGTIGIGQVDRPLAWRLRQGRHSGENERFPPFFMTPRSTLRQGTPGGGDRRKPDRNNSALEQAGFETSVPLTGGPAQNLKRHPLAVAVLPKGPQLGTESIRFVPDQEWARRVRLFHRVGCRLSIACKPKVKVAAKWRAHADRRGYRPAHRRIAPPRPSSTSPARSASTPSRRPRSCGVAEGKPAGC